MRASEKTSVFQLSFRIIIIVYSAKFSTRLLVVNQKAFEIELYRVSKMAILEEWEKHKAEAKNDENKCGELVAIIQKELGEKVCSYKKN